MNKQKKASILIAGAAIILTMGMTSCKKEETPATPEPTKRELLSKDGWVKTVHNWSSDTYFFDALANIKECARDNIYYFKASEEAYITNGPLKCTPGSYDSWDHTGWQFKNNETQIHLDASILGLNKSYDIKLLTTSQLILEVSFYDSVFTDQMTEVIEFKHP